MFHSDASLRQRSPNKKTTVTIEWIAFRAHERDTVFSRSFENSLQPLLKFFGIGHALVIGNAIAIEPLVARAPTQFLSQKRVYYALHPHLTFEPVPVEMREML
jgi:hypothetical protein